MVEVVLWRGGIGGFDTKVYGKAEYFIMCVRLCQRLEARGGRGYYSGAKSSHRMDEVILESTHAIEWMRLYCSAWKDCGEDHGQ
jgi:hypothetical protein